MQMIVHDSHRGKHVISWYVYSLYFSYPYAIWVHMSPVSLPLPKRFRCVPPPGTLAPGWMVQGGFLPSGFAAFHRPDTEKQWEWYGFYCRFMIIYYYYYYYVYVTYDRWWSMMINHDQWWSMMIDDEQLCMTWYNGIYGHCCHMINDD